MGRGRQKAKQTKVARELKYQSGPNTDFQALQRELGSATSGSSYAEPPSSEVSDEEEDPYDDWARRSS